jgi:hypothetical protein
MFRPEHEPVAQEFERLLTEEERVTLSRAGAPAQTLA